MRAGQTVHIKSGGSGLPDWEDYAPDWTINSTPYTDGGLVAQYLVQDNPDGSHTVDVVLMASPVVSTMPAGPWAFTLPFAPVWNSFAMGTAHMFRFPSPASYIGVASAVLSGVIEVFDAGGDRVDDVHPFTWTTGSNLFVTLRYHSV
jgi:hypothetical protein